MVTNGARRRSVCLVCSSAALLSSTFACGADPPLASASDDAASEQGQSPGVDPGSSQGSGDSPAAASGAGVLDVPGYVAALYPPPPYGRAPGSIVENLPFMGWHDPRGAEYDADQLATVQLADFYDPDGEREIELIFVSAVAVWCGVCRLEYDDFRRESYYERMQPRGLAMLGVLFEDNEGRPPALTDLSAWTSNYEVDFPFVIDPGFKTSVFFDRAATPMNMIIDAKTMQILLLTTGYSDELFDEIEALLQARGR